MNLDLHLTTACNMKCHFCGAWEYGRKSDFISADSAKSALDTGYNMGSWILIKLYKHTSTVLEHTCAVGI